MNNAKRAPMMMDPTKITKNSPEATKISSVKVLSFCPILSTVSYITIPMASLKIDSPKTIAYKLTSASISLKIASTDTGSVALMRLPKAKESFHVKSGDKSV